MNHKIAATYHVVMQAIYVIWTISPFKGQGLRLVVVSSSYENYQPHFAVYLTYLICSYNEAGAVVLGIIQARAVFANFGDSRPYTRAISDERESELGVELFLNLDAVDPMWGCRVSVQQESARSSQL